MPEFKERRCDTHIYVITLIWVDLLFYLLKYSLPSVLWHDSLLFFLPAESPLRFFFLYGCFKCWSFSQFGSSSSSLSLSHVKAPRDSRGKLYSHEPHIDVSSPYPSSELQSHASNCLPANSSWSICHLEEWELKIEIKVPLCQNICLSSFICTIPSKKGNLLKRKKKRYWNIRFFLHIRNLYPFW